MREEAAIRKALKKAKEEEEEAVRAAFRRKLEEEALEQERIERGVPDPEPEPEPEPVLVELPEVVEEPENIAPVEEVPPAQASLTKKKHLSMKGLKKRMINVVNAVNDHVITPLKNKMRRADLDDGVAFDLPLSDEKKINEYEV